jgi:deazaflavin-dependent oxidoreductase (nitroreductase family)
MRMAAAANDWQARQLCYLTTTGRRSGRPHTVEMWFAASGRRLYLLAGNGERADWVRNLRANPRVTVRFGDEVRSGLARVVADRAADSEARRLLAGKYQAWREGLPLSTWARTALPVVIELDEVGSPPLAAGGGQHSGKG